MNNLALFDLDHTLLPIDSDYEWGQFLVRLGVVDSESFQNSNANWFAQYQAGTMDPIAYLEFAFHTLAQFPRDQLNQWHQQFMREVIEPNLHDAALNLVKAHQHKGDLVAIVTATNRFITAPIAHAFGVDHLIASTPETDAQGNITGALLGTPTYGSGKVTHTHQWLASLGKTLNDFPASFFYSDSHNDIPLLTLVTHPVATNPSHTLANHAKMHSWPTLYLFND